MAGYVADEKKRVEIDGGKGRPGGGQPEQGRESCHVAGAVAYLRARARAAGFPVPALIIATRERRRDGTNTGGNWRLEEERIQALFCAAHM